MAAKINLLPTDLGPGASLLRFANLSKKVAVLVFIIFFVFGILTVGYIFFLKTEITASQNRSNTLKGTITSLQRTEQDLFLLKERIGKIKILLASQTAQGDVSNASGILGAFPGITITNAQIGLGKSTLSGSSQSSAIVQDFFAKLLATQAYKSIRLTSFSFNPVSGYVFGLELSTTNTK